MELSFVLQSVSLSQIFRMSLSFTAAWSFSLNWVPEQQVLIKDKCSMLEIVSYFLYFWKFFVSGENLMVNFSRVGVISAMIGQSNSCFFYVSYIVFVDLWPKLLPRYKQSLFIFVCLSIELSVSVGCFSPKLWYHYYNLVIINDRFVGVLRTYQ